jgi:hypothetical protein
MKLCTVEGAESGINRFVPSNCPVGKVVFGKLYEHHHERNMSYSQCLQNINNLLQQCIHRTQSPTAWFIVKCPKENKKGKTPK